MNSHIQALQLGTHMTSIKVVRTLVIRPQGGGWGGNTAISSLFNTVSFRVEVQIRDSYILCSQSGVFLLASVIFFTFSAGNKEPCHTIDSNTTPVK